MNNSHRSDETQLDFSDDEQGRALSEPLLDRHERPAATPADEPGMTGAATLSESEHEDNVTLDDLSPDTLIDDSGARSPLERGDDRPLDEELRVVDESQVDLGIGLDEAELARSAPLDGEPWSDEVITEAGEKR